MQPNPYEKYFLESIDLYTEKAAKAQKTYKKWSYYKNHAKKARTRKKYLNKLRRAYKKYPQYRWFIPSKDYAEVKHGLESGTFKKIFQSELKTLGGNWSKGSGAGMFETALGYYKHKRRSFLGNWAGNPVEDIPEDNCSNCQIGADTHEIYPGSCPFYKKTLFKHCKNHQPLRFGEGRWKDE